MKIDYKKDFTNLIDQPTLLSPFIKNRNQNEELRNSEADLLTSYGDNNKGELKLTVPACDEEPIPNKAEPGHSKPHPEIDAKIRVLKRTFDILFSLFIIILGFPVMVILYLITKFSSKGPAIYKQERVGKHERPFYIYKFRSMRTDAETAGPQLSSTSDHRITRWGRVIRRTRLDELPQFYNVLIGEMSIVGPRPERQYFINKIVERNPDYKKLHRLKPGLTSMGQVHYGYAENVDQMCVRMLYDLDYMDSINLNADLKVIMKTVKVMIQCKGK
jgi:lipopolysaccharide/colanic/teichoic acid biosynthesis glycosyltransferase